MEGVRWVNADAWTNGIPSEANRGQPEHDAGTEIAVVCTPYVNDNDGNTGDYYRVIPKVTSDAITALWVVFPSHDGALPAEPGDLNSYDHKRLLWEQ
jgi:hypothetical protein